MFKRLVTNIQYSTRDLNMLSKLKAICVPISEQREEKKMAQSQQQEGETMF